MPTPTRRTEDYLEAIYVMIINGEKPRIRELARRLGVKPSSVVDYLKRLAREGYIVYEKGGRIELTDKGRVIAEKTYRRHMIISRFLQKLGVPRDIAERDACYIEHYITPITLEKIVKYLEESERNS